MQRNGLFDTCVARLPSLAGKAVAITGSTSGTGYWCAVAAAMKGAAMIMLVNRNSVRAEDALHAIRKYSSQDTEVVHIPCDLASFSSVRAAAVQIAQKAVDHGGLSVLCNNAGIMGFPDERTEDGFDVQMQTNHTSHFLLTKLLMGSLEAAAEKHGDARVVQHSSAVRYLLPLKLDERYFLRCEPGALGGDGLVLFANFVRYHMTKLANSTFAMALHAKLAARGSAIKSLVAEPGVADTQLTPGLLEATGRTSKLIRWLGSLLSRHLMQSAADGATPLIACCFSEAACSGDFLAPSRFLWGAPSLTVQAGHAKFGLINASERLTMSESGQDLLWKASETAIGEAWLV